MSTYRRYLGANIGRDAVLWTSDFEIRENESGQTLLLIKDYEIKKIFQNNISAPKPKSLDHLWIKIPSHLERSCKETIEASRKISIKGCIKSYRYKNSCERNVTLDLHSIYQLKPKKTKKIKYA